MFAKKAVWGGGTAGIGGAAQPNPLVAENLKIVQGEIDTTYLLEGLQAEKKY